MQLSAGTTGSEHVALHDWKVVHVQGQTLSSLQAVSHASLNSTIYLENHSLPTLRRACCSGPHLKQMQAADTTAQDHAA